MASQEQKKGQITITAKNIKGTSHGQILEESKRTRNTAGGKHIQNGANGGVSHNVNKERKLPLELRVLKVEGPFDPDTKKKVDVIEKEKKYNYKVTQYNRTPKKEELKNLKWGIKYDDGKVGAASQVTGFETISYFVSKDSMIKKIRVYAYFQKPIDKVSVEAPLIREEILIIIGTEQHSTNKANKLMFPGEAVRTVRTKYPKYPFLKIALFKDGYTEGQLNAITNALIAHNKDAEVIKVENIDNVVNLINSGDKDSSAVNTKRKVKTIYAYSHGYVRSDTNDGVIAFGYEGKNASSQELDAVAFSKIKKEVFLDSNSSLFYSYACRTGIGTSSEVTTEPNKNNSLAQKMSNSGKITVYGYMRRSLYEDAWGTQLHRDTYASDNDAGDSGWENFKTDVKVMLKSKPADIDKFTTYRKKETKIDGAIWNPDGAYLDVKAGEWPKGVPATFEKYTPK